MDRRTLLKGVCTLPLLSAFAKEITSKNFPIGKRVQDLSSVAEDDRAYWVELLQKMASPILGSISNGEFRKTMPMEVSPSFDNRDSGVGYLEAFGRLLAGISPWLSLPDDLSKEGKLRKLLREQALSGIKHGVDPDSPDYFVWDTSTTKQPLVDAAYLAHALLRAPKALWEPLSDLTKQQLITAFKGLRKIQPNESNWLLFAAMPETFLYVIGEDVDRKRIDYAVNKFDKEWYVGDGWYSDGPRFSFDHYNGYVIHCMQVDVLLHNIPVAETYKTMYHRAYKRMQRYAHHLERMIAPDGSFVVVGRSSTYRNGAFQPLAAVALDDKLPNDLKKGQVRASLTAVLKKIFVEDTFKSSGWLTMGVSGNQQTNLADVYTNAGSMYMASLSFLPLGLPADSEFWTCAPEKWTSQKIWSGETFPKDYYVTY